MLNKVKDYARRRKLDTTAQKNVQHGGDPRHVGAVHDHWDYKWDEEEIDAVGYFGYEAEGQPKGKGKGCTSGGATCYICGGTSHFARDGPHEGKGKGKKGKVKGGFQ